MARASMTAIITQVRLMVNDPAGASQVFTDDQVQDSCDQNRHVYNYYPLLPLASFSGAGSVVSYLTYYALESQDIPTFPQYTSISIPYLTVEPPVGDRIIYWETDAKVYNSSTTEIVGATVDYQAGVWVFPTSQTPPVLIVGKAYDLAGAAEDLLRYTAAQSKADILKFSIDGQMIDRSQIQAQVLSLADYWGRRRKRGTRMATRNDGL